MIYLTHANGDSGPYAEEQVRHLHASGALPPGTRYWRAGMAGWEPLEGLLGDAPASSPMLPPPLPVDAVELVRPTSGTRPVDLLPLRGLTAAVGISSAITAAACASLIVFLLGLPPEVRAMDMDVLHTSDEMGIRAMLQFIAIGMVMMLGMLSLMLCLSAWIYRAQHNLRRLGAEHLRFGPVWAIVWWFVPLANQVVPYLMLLELSRASQRPRRWALVKAHASVYFWWVLTILPSIVSMIGSLVGYAPEPGVAMTKVFQTQSHPIVLFGLVCQVVQLGVIVWTLFDISQAQEAAAKGEDTEPQA